MQMKDVTIMEVPMESSLTYIQSLLRAANAK